MMKKEPMSPFFLWRPPPRAPERLWSALGKLRIWGAHLCDVVIADLSKAVLSLKQHYASK